MTTSPEDRVALKRWNADPFYTSRVSYSEILAALNRAVAAHDALAEQNQGLSSQLSARESELGRCLKRVDELAEQKIPNVEEMLHKGKITNGERIVARCFGTTAGYVGLVQMIDEAVVATPLPDLVAFHGFDPQN